MTQIRVDTDHTREVARRLLAEGDHLAEIGHELQRATGSLGTGAWDGRSRSRAEPLLSRVRPESARVADGLDELGRKLRRVADTFEQEDDTAARNLEGMPWVDWDTEDNLALSLETIIENNRRAIQEKWDAMTFDERKKWIEDWYKKLCQKWSILPTNLEVKNLYDPEGKDAKGVYKNGMWFGWFRSITVDVDNVKDNDPFDVMETIAHETRHQYQHYLVEHPDKRPENISEDQIKNWKENFSDYKKPQDDLEAYRKQPVERDAREAGSQAVDAYLGSSEEML